MTSTSAPADPGLLLRSPLLRRLVTLVGWLCVFATLALLSPGVVATARADQAAGDAGPSCQAAGPSDEQMSIALAQMIERLRARADTQGGSASDVMGLNTRGYNYGEPVPAPAAFDRDRLNR